MAILTNTPEETHELGRQLGKCLKPGDIVLLFGDLGAGKTTLTQGICHGLGLPAGEYIRSPTFTLINEYQGNQPIYHVDLYRLETQEEIENLGLEEILFGKGVTLVEWAEKLHFFGQNQPFLLGNEGRIEVRISYIKENQRSLSIEPVNWAARPTPVFSLQ
ncbi:MAG: tRNA (adenosine(37)-N6)-threonylcarbamoyltransferase complex ATPase subunit type 1 TsaE [Nitrospinaceae bacterium]|nr:MAG: tRNA (adenosine(37)-N6)-threonylcarbamoyltransferase complex ATPase subunit type 1 TsaE [Nitrospinaceae bacterium]